MKKILIINYKTQHCGIQQYGYNFGVVLQKYSKNLVEYLETDSVNEFINFLNGRSYDYFIFNWLNIKMKWVDDNILRQYSDTKKLFIFHDFNYPNIKSTHYILHQDPTKTTNNITEFNLGRFLFDTTNQQKLNEKKVISSFGFAFFDKGFDYVVKKVNEEFQDSIIRLHLPYNTIVNEDKFMKKEIIKLCELSNGNNNQLVISENYMSNTELLNWLSERTLNCFFYHNKPSLGISSVIDYALSVNVPLAITKCDMFRHICKDEILIEKNSLKEIIDRGINPLIQFKKNWSGENYGKNLDNIIDLLNKMNY